MANSSAPPAAATAQAAPNPPITSGTAVAMPRASLHEISGTNTVVGVVGSSEMSKTERGTASAPSLRGSPRCGT